MRRLTVDGLEATTFTEDVRGLRAYLQDDEVENVNAEVQVAYFGDGMTVAIAGDTDAWVNDRGHLMIRVYPNKIGATANHSRRELVEA